MAVDDRVAVLDGTGTVNWYARAPTRTRFIGPPHALGVTVKNEALVFAIAVAHSDPRGEHRFPIAETYQLGTLSNEEWVGSVAVMNSWSQFRSISGCRDADGDGILDVCVLNVEASADDFVDGIVEGLLAKDSQVMVISGRSVGLVE